MDFSDAPFFDLVAGTMVPVDEARVNTTRRLLRLPSRWRSVEQQELSDERGGLVDSGRVSEFADDSFGSPDAPWELELSHGWQRLEVVFQFYDVDAKDVRPVPFGPIVEAFDDSRRREKDLAAASTVLDASGRVHLAFFRSVEPAAVRIQLRTAEDSVVVTTEPDPELRVQRVDATTLAGMLIPARQRNYPLPSLWLSRGQACRTTDATSSGATLFESAIEASLTTAIAPSRLYFDLDDFVLVNGSGVPIGFARALDVTVFHRDMSIRAPKAGQGYFSNIAAASNHFAGNNAFYSLGAGPEKVARVVRRGKRFYDLKRQRTRRGRIIGARAAVAGDHPHKHIFSQARAWHEAESCELRPALLRGRCGGPEDRQDHFGVDGVLLGADPSAQDEGHRPEAVAEGAGPSGGAVGERELGGRAHRSRAEGAGHSAADRRWQA